MAALPDQLLRACRWLEATALSAWVREDPSIFAFPTILTLHTIGMALVVGVGVALDLRVLGIARDVPIVEMRRFLPAMWTGLWLNIGSGVLLLIGYPTKALTNPLFYVKLSLIAGALATLRSIVRRAFRNDGGGSDPPGLRLAAATSVFCWTAAVAAGRLLAYTYTRLMAS